MRNAFLICGLAGFGMALSACSTAPARKPAASATAVANHGGVSGELVEAGSQQRYSPEPGVTYEQPAAFPDNPKPIYPTSLLPRALAPVVVAVKIVVSDEGSVSEVVPVDVGAGEDNALFFDSVRTALTQWKFLPLVKVVKGGPKTVISVGDISTTYDGQASRLPFSQGYKFTFSQVSGAPSISETSAEAVH